jgi:hypothetical protein
MKTKSRIKITPQTKPLTHLVWVDIHDSGKLADGLHQPVAYGFMSPHLVKLLNRLLHGSRLGEVDDGQDGHTIETISKSGWEQVTK